MAKQFGLFWANPLETSIETGCFRAGGIPDQLAQRLSHSLT